MRPADHGRMVERVRFEACRCGDPSQSGGGKCFLDRIARHETSVSSASLLVPCGSDKKYKRCGGCVYDENSRTIASSICLAACVTSAGGSIDQTVVEHVGAIVPVVLVELRVCAPKPEVIAGRRKRSGTTFGAVTGMAVFANSPHSGFNKISHTMPRVRVDGSRGDGEGVVGVLQKAVVRFRFGCVVLGDSADAGGSNPPQGSGE
jgi:hypothetical protein